MADWRGYIIGLVETIGVRVKRTKSFPFAFRRQTRRRRLHSPPFPPSTNFQCGVESFRLPLSHIHVHALVRPLASLRRDAGSSAARVAEVERKRDMLIFVIMTLFVRQRSSFPEWTVRNQHRFASNKMWSTVIHWTTL